MEIFWGRSAKRTHEPPLAHNLNSLRAWWQPSLQARMGWPGLHSQPGPRSNSPVKTTVSRSRSTDAATAHADWADRPSQTLHGEQAGKDRATRPIPRRLCTQARSSTSSHLTTEVSNRTTGQRHSRSVFEPRSPACRGRIARQEGCRNGGGVAIFVAPAFTSIHLRRLTTSLCAGVVRQT